MGVMSFGIKMNSDNIFYRAVRGTFLKILNSFSEQLRLFFGK